MVIKSDKHKIQQLLSEAITVLCKNGLNYDSHVNVEALIGITLDDDEVLLVSVKETIPQVQKQLIGYNSSPPNRPKAAPSRKRPAPIPEQSRSIDGAGSGFSQTESDEPAAKRVDHQHSEEDNDVIQIKGEEQSEEEGDESEKNTGEAPTQDTDPPDEEGNDYNASQLEQFVNFATSTQPSDIDHVDSKAAVFAGHGMVNPPDTDSPFTANLPTSQHPAARGSQRRVSPSQRRVSPRQAAKAAMLRKAVLVAKRTTPRLTKKSEEKKDGQETDESVVKEAQDVESPEKGAPPSKGKTVKKVLVVPSVVNTRRSRRRTGAEQSEAEQSEAETKRIEEKTVKNQDGTNEITIEIEIEKGKDGENNQEREEGGSLVKENAEETMNENVDRLLKTAREVEYFKPFTCPVCDVTFQYKYPHLSRGKLKNHMKKHEGIIYKCDECDKCFNNPVNLKTHQRGMHNKEFLCSECGKTFYNRPNLERHIAAIHWKVEEKKLPYVCGECGKRFHNSNHLLGHQISDHQASHKRYKCETCGRSYVYGRSLQKHKCPPKAFTIEELRQMGYNDAEAAVGKQGEQFLCLICKLVSKTKARAKMHARMHFQEFYLHCEYCGKGFNGSAELHSHINVIHHKQKEFMCYICGENRTFSYRRCVQEHMRKVHKMSWHIYTHKYNLDNNGHPLSEEQLSKMKQHEQERLERYVLNEKVKIVDSALQQGDVNTPLEILATIGQGLMSAQAQGEEVVQHFQLAAAAEEVVSATNQDGSTHHHHHHQDASNIIPIAVESAGIPVTAAGQMTRDGAAQDAGVYVGRQDAAGVYTVHQGETVALVQEDGQEVVQEQYIAIDSQQGEILSVQTDPLDSNTIIIEYANNEEQGGTER